MEDLFAFDQATAEAIVQILVDEVGLRDDRGETYGSAMGYQAVMRWLMAEQARGGEMRLNASLGFGGKLRVYYGRRAPYVDYYHEDETSERREAALRANERLNVLFAERELNDLLVSRQ